jgi:hypothetical protein
MWPFSAVRLSSVARPCYRRSCPNGPRFDQREIMRMMSLLALNGQNNCARVCRLLDQERTKASPEAEPLGSV